MAFVGRVCQQATAIYDEI